MAEVLPSNRVAAMAEGKIDEKATHIPVHIPDMFVLFLSEPPAANLHYDQVRREAEAWLSQSVKIQSFIHQDIGANNILK